MSIDDDLNKFKKYLNNIISKDIEINSIDNSALIQLYYWFDFHNSDSTIDIAENRCINVTDGDKQDLNETRIYWASILSEDLWNNPHFIIPRDGCSVNDHIKYTYAQFENSNNRPMTFIHLDRVPGSIIYIYAKGIKNISKRRLFLDVNGNYWVGRKKNTVAKSFTLSELFRAHDSIV